VAVVSEAGSMVCWRDVLSQHALPAACCGGEAKGFSLTDVDEDTARRRSKRRRAVSYAKGTLTYAHAKQKCFHMVGQLQPDPDDTALSKRAWEKAFAKWRTSLRAMAQFEHTSAGAS